MNQELFKDLLLKRYQDAPDQIIYILTDNINHRLTYSALLEQSTALALSLQAWSGLDNVVILAIKPSLDFIRMVFACLLADRIFLPTYPITSLHGSDRLESFMEHFPSSLLICDQYPSKGFSSCFHNRIQTIDEIRQISCAKSLLNHVGPNEARPVFLQQSSGTTHYPRAVNIGNDALMACLQNMKETLDLSNQDIGCSWLPPYHDMGLIGGIFLPLYVNFPVHLISPKSFILHPLGWLKTISDQKVTVTAAPNLAYDLCTFRHQKKPIDSLDLSHLRVCINGAEVVRASTLRAFYHTFKACGLKWEAFVPSYGLAEATLMVSCHTIHTPPYIESYSQTSIQRGVACLAPKDTSDGIDLVSSGKAIINMGCIIVHPNTARLLKPYEIGEIWITGSSLASGYFNNDQATEATYQEISFDHLSMKYCRTGDIGFMDKDNNLFVISRLKDCITTKMGNIFPEQIEEIVDDSFSLDPIYRSAAFLVEDPCRQEEDSIVILKEVKSVPSQEQSFNICSMLQEKLLINVSKLMYIHCGDLPRTTSGKIKRSASKILLKYDFFDVISYYSNESIMYALSEKNSGNIDLSR